MVMCIRLNKLIHPNVDHAIEQIVVFLKIQHFGSKFVSKYVTFNISRQKLVGDRRCWQHRPKKINKYISMVGKMQHVMSQQDTQCHLMPPFSANIGINLISPETIVCVAVRFCCRLYASIFICFYAVVSESHKLPTLDVYRRENKIYH